MTSITDEIFKATGIRTFELLVYVDQGVEGDINDWPANLQDGILKALEKKSTELELPLVILSSTCIIDFGDIEDQDRPYLHIIASEIVMADEREVNKYKHDIDLIVANTLKQEGKLN